MPTHALKVDPEHHHARVDVFLAKHLPDIPSRTFVKKLIDGGCVTVNENLVKPNHKVSQGDDVFVRIPDNFLEPQFVAPEKIDLDIFYEDDYFYVIHKPSGMLVHPAKGRYSGTLVNALLHHAVNLSDFNTHLRPGIVHRLDEETSGLMVVAKDNITHTKLAKQFQRHTVKKVYVALVEGNVEFDEGVVNAPIGRNPKHRDRKDVQFDDAARESMTRYKVLKRANGVSLVALSPKTGRTHQLRVHMKHLGYPILGDEKYGRRATFSRLALHAQCWVEFSTPIPKEFLEKVR